MQYEFEPSNQSSVEPRLVPFVPSRTIYVNRKEWNRVSQRTHRPLASKTSQPLVSEQPLPAPTPFNKVSRCISSSVLGAVLTRCSQYWCRERRGAAEAAPFRSVLGIPILPPDATLVSTWIIIMALVDVTYTAFLVPVSIAFDDSVQRSMLTWLTILDVVGSGFYFFDMVFNLHVGYVVSHDVRSTLVMTGRDIAWFYVRHGTFIIDFLSTIAIVPQLVATSIEGATHSAYNAFAAIRLLRLLRVTRLLTNIWSVTLTESPITRFITVQLGTAGLFLLKIIFAMCILINLLGCMWWFIAELEGLESSWAAHTADDFNFDLLTAHDTVRYVASIYFALTTLTTVGYGDITAVTVAECCLVMAYMTCSLLYFGYIVNVVGQLLHLVTRSTQSAGILRDKLEETEHWMTLRHIPKDLMQAVRRYYQEHWAVHGSYDDAGYFKELPVGIRVDIVKRMAGDALEESKLFRKLGEDVKTHLASTALPRRLLVGHDLFTEGEAADNFYVLQEGTVARVRGMHDMGAVTGLAILGQSSVFAPYIDDAKERMYTVRALTNCSLWEFNALSLARLGKHHPQIQRVLCDTYLEYLEKMKREVAQHGQGPKKHLQRIEQQVKTLLRHAEQALREEEENKTQGTYTEGPSFRTLSMDVPLGARNGANGAAAGGVLHGGQVAIFSDHSEEGGRQQHRQQARPERVAIERDFVREKEHQGEIEMVIEPDYVMEEQQLSPREPFSGKPPPDFADLEAGGPQPQRQP